MKVYNSSLDIIDASYTSPYEEMQFIIHTLYDIKINANVCIVHNTVDIGGFAEKDNIVDLTDEAADKINEANIDLVILLVVEASTPLSDISLSAIRRYEQIKKNKVIITPEYNNYLPVKLKQIEYAGMFTFICRALTFNNHPYPIDNIPYKKKYLFSSLMGVIRANRISNFIEFKKSNYFNKSLITLNAIKLYPGTTFNETVNWIHQELYNIDPTYIELFNKDIIPALPIKICQNESDILLIDPNNSLPAKDLLDPRNSAYLDSYINVAVETRHHYPLFTDKVIKSFLAEQFFVMIGGKNLVATMKRAGIDVYDDIIDHAVYDQDDDGTRIQSVHKLLNDIQYYDWEEIYRDTRERRKYNRHLMENQVLERKFKQQIIECL